MGVGVELRSVPFFELRERRLERSELQSERDLGAAVCLVLARRFDSLDQQFGAQPRHPFEKAKEIFGAQKEPAVGPLGPAEAQGLSETTLRLEPIVLLDLGAADRRQSRRRGDALEQRRLARAVFAHEKGDWARERQPLERPDGGNRERKGLIGPTAAADRGQVDWTHGSNIPAAGSVAPHLQRRVRNSNPLVSQRLGAVGVGTGLAVS